MPSRTDSYHVEPRSRVCHGWTHRRPSISRCPAEQTAITWSLGRGFATGGPTEDHPFLDAQPNRQLSRGASVAGLPRVDPPKTIHFSMPSRTDSYHVEPRSRVCHGWT